MNKERRMKLIGVAMLALGGVLVDTSLVNEGGGYWCLHLRCGHFLNCGWQRVSEEFCSDQITNLQPSMLDGCDYDAHVLVEVLRCN